MKKRREVIIVTIFYVVLLSVWHELYALKLVPDYVFPSPSQVMARLSELVEDNMLLPSIRATFGRMLLGFTIATAIGLTLGILMGTRDIVNSCLKSLFMGLLTLPTAAWSPIGLMLYGLNDNAIYFVIVMSAAPAIAISSSDAIRRIPPIYLQAAKTLGTPGHLVPFKVIFPAAFPNILTGVKLGWTLGWHGAVSAELIKSSVGLGFLLHMGRELNDAPQVIGIMLITIGVGLLIDRCLFSVLEKKIHSRWGLQRV